MNKADEDVIRDLLAERHVTVAEAARYLGICRAKLYGMMEAREITYAKFGKSRRIPIQALREYARRSLVSV